ncbi:hypothetical protein CMI42_02875 [Candidatus Pacearchaeota archaeon]|nr:hypothetical protein [Candidatus Pacearchaeota archaeon]|tara:strand:- start:1432 stop:1677 length:246 start_codon:yes stop_codon:yes gene_type:complete
MGLEIALKNMVGEIPVGQIYRVARDVTSISEFEHPEDARSASICVIHNRSGLSYSITYTDSNGNDMSDKKKKVNSGELPDS